MSVPPGDKSLYLAIASYRDAELVNTVYSALNNAKNKDNIFFYIFSQDEDHPKLESLFDLFNTKNYFYDKEHYLLSTGVGYARARTQKLLSEEYKYYFQVDSHTQFSKDWDEKIIYDYQRLSDLWGDYIFSSYPPGYDYQEHGDIKFITDGVPPAVSIREDAAHAFRFQPSYDIYYGKEEGQPSGYFCAGLAFGFSKLFLRVPYDDQIYFQGEEHSMSLRFYDQGIKIICPPSVYVFHDYEGSRRVRNWENNPDWSSHDAKSSERIKNFLAGDSLNGFGLSSLDRYQEWYSCYVSPKKP